jgi:predicted lipoprotein
LSGGAGGSNVPDVVPVTFSKAALLAAAADCTLAELRNFITLATALRDQATKLAEARTDENVADSRRAFRDAMAAWQRLEVHRFGPAARKSEDPIGGQDLRDEIYAWPLGGRCNIETQLVSSGYARPNFSTQLINVRGLGTLEYLLFNDDADNGCPAYSPLNAQGTWALLGLEQIRARKAEYARVVADDVLTHAEALVGAWEQGRFRDQLSEAGTKNSRYPSQQAALNAVSNAIFYVEREVKDMKLALPLGISPECASGLCPESLESQYAGLSTDNIQQNLIGFQQLFWGCGPRASGLGFDDWLHEVGAGELEQRMRLAFDAAKSAVDELEPPLEQAISARPDATRAMYDRLKALTDLLKTEFVSALQLELPTGSETDND